VESGDEQLFVPLVDADAAAGAGGHCGAAWPLAKYLARARARAGEAEDSALVERHAVALDSWLRSQWQLRRAQLAAAREPLGRGSGGAQSRELQRRCRVGGGGAGGGGAGGGGAGGGGEGGGGEGGVHATQPSYPSRRLCVVATAEQRGGCRLRLEPRPEGQRAEHALNGECFAKLKEGYKGAARELNARLFLLLQVCCNKTDRQRGGSGDRHTHTHTHTHTQREREREIDRQTDRQTDRERERGDVL